MGNTYFNFQDELSHEDTEVVIDFLKAYKDLLKENNLKEVYRYTIGMGVLPGLLTQFLLTQGIEIFNYLDKIPNFCFICSSLDRISIPKNIVKIGTSAFKETQLTEITIPGNIKIINNYAFKECYNLKKVIIEEGVRRIYGDAFSEIGSNSEIYLPNSIDYIDSPNFFDDTTIVYCHKNSYAEEWCLERDITPEIY